MANQIIRPDDLPPRANPVASEVVPSDNGSIVAGVTWADGVNAGRPLASQNEAEAGVQATKAMTPLTTKQAIDAQVPAIVGGAIAGLGLGTAAQADTGDFATAAQGLLADTAVQPGDLAPVATSGSYLDLTDKPTLSDETSAQSRAWAVANLHPVSAPSFIRTAGYSVPGDLGGALYKWVVNEPSHPGKFSIILDDGATVAWYEIAESVIAPRMLGAAGDGDGQGGGTDDAAAFQSALGFLAATGGGIIDGGGRTYRIDTALTYAGSDLCIRNMKIDASQLASGARLFECIGSLATPVALSSSATVGDDTLAVVDGSSFARNDWIKLTSNASPETLTNASKGEWLRVASVSGNTLSLFQPIYDTYATGNTAQVQKASFRENITFEEVQTVGGGDGTEAGSGQQYGLWLELCYNVNISGYHSLHFDNRHIEIRTCVNVWVEKSSFERSNYNAGVSYGVAVNRCCQNVWVERNYFAHMKHGAVAGGTHGINRNINFNWNTCVGCVDGGIDFHPPVQFGSIVGNKILVSNLDTEQKDGIVCQGIDVDIRGNTVEGCQNYGILVQCYWSSSYRGSFNISDNILLSGYDAASMGILVQCKGTNVLNSVLIGNNQIRRHSSGAVRWGTGIRLDIDGTAVDHVGINGNQIEQVDGRVIHVNLTSGRNCRYATFNDNVGYSTSTTVPALHLVSGDANAIQYGTIVGNVMRGGSYAIRGENTQRIITTGNVAMFGNTANILVDGTASVLGDNVSA